MQITILGHASVLVDAAGERVLVDPLFTDRFANGAIGFHPGRVIHRDRLPEPSALVVTHLHLDHWHPPTLETFDRSIPVVSPPDPFIQRRLAELGFTNVIVAAPWVPIRIGDLELTPTPSTAEVEEFGLAFRHDDLVYWHMSDSDVEPDDGCRVRDQVGRPAVVATRYQPITPLISFQRGLGISHDERDGVVSWLEAACATDPTFVFPYFCDIDYLDEHEWANAYARPFHPDEIAGLLRRRLHRGPGADGHEPPLSTVHTVAPGDVLTITAPTDVDHAVGAAPFVDLLPTTGRPYEPFDPATLFGVAENDRPELEARWSWWVEHEFVPWLAGQLDNPSSPAQNLVRLQVRWHAVIHVGDGHRLACHVDFGAPAPRLLPGQHDFPNYAIHIGGRALLAVLRGDGGNELFWLAAASRVYEKVLCVDDGHIVAPPVRGWDLFESVPEPVSWCLRKHGAGGAIHAFDRA